MKTQKVVIKKREHHDMLHTAGLRATQGRVQALAIMDALALPMSAGDLYEQMQGVDEATVYRMMHDFEKKGLVRQVDLRTDIAQYELASHAHHHHIVCTECGMIEDVPECGLDNIIAGIARKSAHFAQVDEHAFELFGICSKCAQ